MSSTAGSPDAIAAAIDALGRKFARRIESLERRIATAIPDPLLTRKDLARILSVNQRTITTMIEDGRLPPGKIIGYSGGKPIRRFATREIETHLGVDLSAHIGRDQ